MAVTYYVALPFLPTEEGVAPGQAQECPNEHSAIRQAEAMSRKPPNVGALAFKRTGDPSMGNFGDATILKTVGALRGQISSVYLAGVIVYGLLAVAVAVPLGALGGVLLSGYILRILNVPGSGYQLLPQIVAAQLATGLLVPLLAAIWPVLQGVGVSVREALSSYGVGQGRFGTRWLDQFLGSLRGLPRMVLLMLRNSVRRLERVALTQVVLVTAGAIFMMVLSTHYSFIETIAETWRAFGYDGYVVFEQPQLIPEVVDVLAARPGIERVEMWLWQSAQTTLPKIIQAVGAEKGPPAQMRGDRGGSVGGNSSGTGWRVGLRGVPLDTKMFKPKIVAGRGLQAGEQRSMLLNEKLAADVRVLDTLMPRAFRNADRSASSRRCPTAVWSLIVMCAKVARPTLLISRASSSRTT